MTIRKCLPRVLSDWNRLDVDGRVRLDIVGHAATDLTALAGAHVLLVDGNEVVEGRVERAGDSVWLGVADWDTQRAAVGDEDELTHPHPTGVWCVP